jgi:hypothetical protein
MGGKTSQSSSQVSIPPEVLARYNSVNARAEEVGNTPFQQYGGEFVAGLTPTQQAGIQNTSAATNQAQPYYGAATGMALAGAMPVNPGGLQTSQYMNPFTQAVAAPTYEALRQQQGQERTQQQAQAIKSGAFGGDRAGLERANLARQQELGTAQAIAPIFQQGYGQALQTAQQQQGVGLAAGQANRAALQQSAQQLAGLGTGAQQAALQGAQAQLAAGTAEQQTNQADLTARYQQFLQERGYPFQTAQFLANIAMGTGALSGSTTTSTQPAGFFSDERLKEDIKRVGETDDGMPIYSYRYKGDKETQIGLIAQDVEKKKPEAVGLAPAADGHLYKTVDYKKATEDKPHKSYGGGLDVNSMGGAVLEPGHFSPGGMVDANDMRSILAAIGKPVGAYGNKNTLGSDPIGAIGVVPSGGIATPRLATASNVGTNRQTGISDVVGNVKSGIEAYKMGKAGLMGTAPTATDKEGSAGLIGGQGTMGGKNIFSEVGDFFKKKEEAAHGGLIVGRHHYGDGGDAEDDNNDNNNDANEDRAHVPSSALPSDVLKSGAQHGSLATAGGRGGAGGGDTGLGQLTQGISAVKGLGSMFGEGGMFSGAGDMFSGAGEAGAGEGIGEMFAAFVANGGAINGPGLVVRQHHADGERVMADDPGLVIADYSDEADLPALGAREAMQVDPGLKAPPKYKIEPQNKEDMEPHKQDLINYIYPREGGLDAEGQPKYNVRQGTGKETFDVEAGHPGLKPAPGGKSSASGAGQFINATWNRVTGGAPMTKGYQDAATWQLASDDYAARTGRDLDADLKEKGLTPQIKSALKPTWQGIDAPGGGRSLAVSRGAEGKSSDSGAEPKESGLSLKGIGDTVTSDKFLVPFLSFVGSTLASKSPNLGGALGEGIVGGVAGYQQNKKVQAEMAKGVLDIVKDRFNITTDPVTGKTIYFSKADGRTLSPAQYASAVGGIADSLGVPRGVLGISTEGTEVRGASGTTQPGQFTRPSEEAMRVGTAAKPGAGKTEVAAAPEVTDTRLMNPNQLFDNAIANKEKYKLIGDRDPDALLAEANQYKRIAASARIAGKDSEAAAATQNAKDALDRRNQYVKDAISQEVENNKQILQAKNEDSAESYKAARGREQTYQADRALITRTADILSDYRAGRLSEVRSYIADVANTFGVPLPKGFFNADLNDEFVKSALTQVVAQVNARDLGRAPGTAIKTLQQTVANPNMSPGSSFALIGRTLGDLDKNHDSDVAYIKKGRGADYGEHVEEFNKKQDPNEYYRRAYSSIPEPKGMEDAQRRSLQKTYKYEPRVRMSVEEGATAPSGAAPAQPAAQPAAPEPLRGMTGLLYNPARNQYRDSQGIIYDATGKRVQ